MYERFYGFSELPFELTANPKYLFLSSRQREALSTLQYGLFAAKSIRLGQGKPLSSVRRSSPSDAGTCGVST
jgi:general secretion pathway protein A